VTRSRKKPYVWISKRSDKHTRRAVRRAAKLQCHEAEIDFDPDRDYDIHVNEREFGEWGTWFGYPTANLLDDDISETERANILEFSRK